MCVDGGALAVEAHITWTAQKMCTAHVHLEYLRAAKQIKSSAIFGATLILGAKQIAARKRPESPQATSLSAYKHGILRAAFVPIPP